MSVVSFMTCFQLLILHTHILFNWIYDLVLEIFASNLTAILNNVFLLTNNQFSYTHTHTHDKKMFFLTCDFQFCISVQYRGIITVTLRTWHENEPKQSHRSLWSELAFWFAGINWYHMVRWQDRSIFCIPEQHINHFGVDILSLSSHRNFQIAPKLIPSHMHKIYMWNMYSDVESYSSE